MERFLVKGFLPSYDISFVPWYSGGPTKGMRQMSPQQLGAALTSL